MEISMNTSVTVNTKMKPASGVFWYGGDYNPEQWPEEVRREDMRLLKLAHINTLTLNVFSWARLQPAEDLYDFSELDELMEMAEKNGMQVILATSTGAHPAWMARKYPDILRTDENGIRRTFGGRHNSCPHSPAYRRFAPMLAGKLAERYGKAENLAAWHISNEFGGVCCCENCAAAFRKWLQNKYQTLEELNRVWYTAFWSHTFYDWDEIVVPDLRSEQLPDGQSMFPTISLDYRRFMSDSLLECCRLEAEEIRKYSPDVPITTNMMGFYPGIDYRKWADTMDVISWDAYPAYDDPAARTAMTHDLMRSIGHKPFLLMEQTPSVTNWQTWNTLKRPGVMRLLSYQAIAHGADSVLFFQMRQSRGNCEKLHGAVISHEGSENTRVFREVQALGEELERIGMKLKGAETRPKAAIIYDWDNRWALELTAGPGKDLEVLKETERWYRAFHALNIPVDLAGPHDDLSSYRLVAAPLQYMADERFAKSVESFTKKGGIFAAGSFSGIADEHDLVVLGGYPGYLRKLLGLWVEEFDVLPPGRENSFTYKGKTVPSRIICGIAHEEGARALSVYEKDFYKGSPAVTKNTFGKGAAYYVASVSDDAFYLEFISDLAKESGIEPLIGPQSGLEVTLREKDGQRFLFLLNHEEKECRVEVPAPCTGLLSGKGYNKGETLVLGSYDVEILLL